jgi:hypothetical protein
MGEDQLFMLDALFKSKKVYFHHRVVYEYFVGLEFHLSKQKIAHLDFPKLIDELINRLRKNNLLAIAILSRQILSAIKSRPINLVLLPKTSLELLRSNNGFYLTFLFYRDVATFLLNRS